MERLYHSLSHLTSSDLISTDLISSELSVGCDWSQSRELVRFTAHVTHFAVAASDRRAICSDEVKENMKERERVLKESSHRTDENTLFLSCLPHYLSPSDCPRLRFVGPYVVVINANSEFELSPVKTTVTN